MTLSQKITMNNQSNQLLLLIIHTNQNSTQMSIFVNITYRNINERKNHLLEIELNKENKHF